MLKLQEIVKRNIKTLRKDKGLTIEGASEASGIPYRTWQQAESGKTLPRVQTLELIAHFLSVSPEELFQGSRSNPRMSTLTKIIEEQEEIIKNTLKNRDKNTKEILKIISTLDEKQSGYLLGILRSFLAGLEAGQKTKGKGKLA